MAGTSASFAYRTDESKAAAQQRVRALVVFLLLLAGMWAGCDLFGGSEADPTCQIELEEDAPAGNVEPAGTLVFAAYRIDENGSRRDDGNIYTMDADGSNLQRLTSFGSAGGAINPAWSPDGQTIAFASFYQSTTLGPYLYLIDADGSNMRYLKRLPNEGVDALVGWDPAWSSDGQQIAFSWCSNCERGGRDYGISIVSVAGRDFQSEDMTALTDHPARDGAPTWSPEGKRVAFVSDRAYYDTDEPLRSDVYLANADGSGVRRLTTSGRATGPLWAPNGRKMVVEKEERAVTLLDLCNGSTERVEVKTELSAEYRLIPAAWPVEGGMLLAASKGTSPPYEGQDRLLVLNPVTGHTREISFPANLKLGGVDWFAEAKKKSKR